MIDLHALDRDPEQTYDRTAETVACPECGAAPGVPCRSHPAIQWLSHTRRWEVVPFTATERQQRIRDPYTDLLPYEGTDL